MKPVLLAPRCLVVIPCYTLYQASEPFIIIHMNIYETSWSLINNSLFLVAYQPWSTDVCFAGLISLSACALMRRWMLSWKEPPRSCETHGWKRLSKPSKGESWRDDWGIWYGLWLGRVQINWSISTRRFVYTAQDCIYLYLIYIYI